LIGTAMDKPMTWWIRAYLLYAAIQGFGIGLTGLIVPAEMQIPIRDITPLNHQFVAALYVGGGVGVLLAALSRQRSEARLFVVGFSLATGLILILTVLHWSEFMADPLPHRPLWIIDYVLDPVLAVILVPLAGLWPPARATRHPLTPLLIGEAVVFGVLGLLLLLAPDLAAIYWPWSLQPIVLGQLYACFILTFAVGAALAARESSQRGIRDFLIASLCLCLLVLLVSGLHLDRFKAGPVTGVWFTLFGIGAVACAIGLAVQARTTFWRHEAQTVAQP
jgi:hypothetical protein